MHTALIVAVLVVTGQLGGTGAQPEAPRYPGVETNSGSTNTSDTATSDNTDAWDYSPVSPPASATPTEQPAAQIPTTTAPEVKPADVLKSLSSTPTTGQLAGTEVSLAEAVRGAASRGEQTARVAAYWDLAAAVTDYYLSLREASELEALRQGIAQPGLAWDEARQAQSARTQVARATAEAAQYRLQRLLRRSPNDALPLPSDAPHCGAYETRYEQNFAGRDSSDALQLSELLPQLYDDLKSQAARLTADQQWLHATSQQRAPQSDGAALLKAYDLVGLRRQEFVQSVANYNTQIARYTELATPGVVGTERLVAMLIESPTLPGAAGGDSSIRRTSAEEPLDAGQTAPRTFAEEQRKPVADGGQERSILVQPQQ